MPEDSEVKIPKGEKISLGIAELQALIQTAVQSAVGHSQDALVQALLEARKPYTDPRQLANEAAMRVQMRELKERIDRDIKASQTVCPHFQGSNALSEFQGQQTSIVQHQLDTGIMVGICTNCQRIFMPEDPDYMMEMRRKSGNRPSMAGQRFGLRPVIKAA